MRMCIILALVLGIIALHAQTRQQRQDSLHKLLVSADIPYPKEFTVLAIVESGLVSKNNNLFGMYHPRYRKTTSVSAVGKYAVFATWQDAVTDLYYWVEVSPPKQGEGFIEFIRRRNYNPNPEYYKKLQHLIN